MKKLSFESSFDKNAQIYDEVRPSYPQQLFEDIHINCHTEKLSHILEIGAGTGTATQQLMMLNLPVTAIEPGENLLAIARRKLKAEQNIDFIHSTFEGFETLKKYDMLFSATAFHWPDKEIKYKKADSLLSDEGSLVLVWNNYLRENSTANDLIGAVYKRYFPESGSKTDVNILSLDKLIEREKEVLASDLFYLWFAKRYLTVYKYTAEDYVRLLCTFSDTIKMEESHRKLFIGEIREIVKKQGEVRVPVLSSLYIYRKKISFILD